MVRRREILKAAVVLAAGQLSYRRSSRSGVGRNGYRTRESL